MAQKIRDVMTPNPTALPATTSIADAAHAMRDKDIGDVIVLDGGNRVCGMVTDRDIVVRAVADDRHPSEVRLGDICSRDLTAVGPDDAVEDAVWRMRENALRRLPWHRREGRPRPRPHRRVCERFD